MINVDITNMVNKMCKGKLTVREQIDLGILLKHLLGRNAVKPDHDIHKRPMCPNCGKAINTKMKDGKHIHQYCKICGQHIDWSEEE